MATLRTATLDDHDALMQLMSVLQTRDPPVPASDSLAMLERILSDPALTLLVAEVDGRVVGSCYLNVMPNLTRELRPYALIENVVTDGAVRGQGIGKALLEDACRRAADAGCYKVMLMTGRQDEGIRTFYRRSGFDGDAKHAFYRKL